MNEMKNKFVKIVWHDGENNKAVKGTVIEIDDFSYTLKTVDDNNIVIGKRDLVSIIEIEGELQ